MSDDGIRRAHEEDTADMHVEEAKLLLARADVIAAGNEDLPIEILISLANAHMTLAGIMNSGIAVRGMSKFMRKEIDG